MRGRSSRIACLSVGLIALGGLAAGTGCFRSSSDTGTTDATRATTGSRASDAQRTYPLDTLPTSTVTINTHTFRVWLAREGAPVVSGADHTIVEEGLMYVPTSEIADDQGMLFVFDNERIRSFWMRNTIAPLDIAFARMNGTIVKIWQMPVLTLQTFSSIEPAMYALEVKQGTFERLGIQEGDQLEIPADVLTGQ